MLAYFTGSYPNLTETFVRQEISYLKENNIPLKIFSVRKAQGVSYSNEHENESNNVIYARPDKLLMGIFALPYYFFKKPIILNINY